MVAIEPSTCCRIQEYRGPCGQRKMHQTLKSQTSEVNIAPPPHHARQPVQRHFLTEQSNRHIGTCA